MLFQIKVNTWVLIQLLLIRCPLILNEAGCAYNTRLWVMILLNIFPPQIHTLITVLLLFIFYSSLFAFFLQRSLYFPIVAVNLLSFCSGPFISLLQWSFCFLITTVRLFPYYSAPAFLLQRLSISLFQRPFYILITATPLYS